MMDKKKLKTSLLVVGVVSLIFALIMFVSETGYSPMLQTYGGDAYTGIQNAGAYAAENVEYSNKILSFGFGFFFLIVSISCFLAVYCMQPEGVPLAVKNPFQQQPVQPQPVQQEPVQTTPIQPEPEQDVPVQSVEE